MRRKESWCLMTLLPIALAACVGVQTEDQTESVEGDLSSSQRQARSLTIRDVAAREGLRSSFLLAGIANSETGMAHCWSEATWACKGPSSSSCGGGPVISGSGDGPCHYREGGLGMFQFDAGTHSQTLNRYGSNVLTLSGNVWHGVNYVVEMVVRSSYIGGVSTRAQAIDWLNSVEVDGRNWDAWIKTVTHYYNGCVPGRCSVYWSRYNRYASYTRDLYRELGPAFWGDSATDPAEPATPTGLQPQRGETSNAASIELSWEDPSNSSSYDVDVQYTDNGQWLPYHTWTDHPRARFTLWPQVNDTSYRWRTRSCNWSLCSDFSGWASFTAGDAEGPQSPPEDPPEPPAAPEDGDEGLVAPGSVSPSGGTFSRPMVNLSWSEVRGAATYDVDLMVARDGAWRQYHTWTSISGASFEVWPQVDNADYRWRVRACDASSCSEYSPFEDFYFNGL